MAGLWLTITCAALAVAAWVTYLGHTLLAYIPVGIAYVAMGVWALHVSGSRRA